MTPLRPGRALLVLTALVLAPGCTKEFARVSFSRPATAEVTADLDGGGTVRFGVDAEYDVTGRNQGVTALQAYRLTIAAVQHRKLAALAICSPLRVTSSGWGRERGAGMVRLTDNRVGDCSLDLPAGGPTRFKVTLAELRKPDIRLHYLDVVLER